MAVPSVAPIPAQRASAPPATQKQEASPSPVQVATSPAPGRDQYYRVLINDVSDRALQQVKKIVPDAYVLNLPEGARISLGAFKKESEAKTLVEELRQQGISASINRP
jgi:serine/threonine-protein kinase